MTRYYSALVHDDDAATAPVVAIGEQHADHAAATRHLAARVAAGGYWRPAVLLDLATLTIDQEQELVRVLQTDPVLRAVYELGRQHELLNSANRRDARLEEPECCASGACEVCTPGLGFGGQP